MKKRHPPEFSQLSMLELFRVEVDNQTALLTGALLELERAPGSLEPLETLMRAAHSLKGAARIVHLPAVVRLIHAMEDCFAAAKGEKLILDRPRIDLLLEGVDLLTQLARRNDLNLGRWEIEQAKQIEEFTARLALGVPSGGSPIPGVPAVVPGQPPSVTRPGAGAREAGPDLPRSSAVVPTTDKENTLLGKDADLSAPERVVRLNAENLNRLLGLAGESLTESRWLRPFADSLQRLKRRHGELTQHLDRLQEAIERDSAPAQVSSQLKELSHELAASQQSLSERMEELELYDRRSAHLSHRLYLEVLRTRMRPFADCVRRFPRMARDLARALGKDVKLDISGQSTHVDRDILERLETPLAHLLRNAVDHGCEFPKERVAAGKTPECVVRLDARHSAGMLLVTVADDGQGVPLERVRETIIRNQLATRQAAEKLTESELLEFLFLPGFTLKDTVSEISGRGVGLDVVQNMVKGLRGSIRLGNQPGHGLRVQLQLPLTLSVLRALLVEVAGEPYAIPLTQMSRTLKLSRAEIQSLGGHHHFQLGGQQVGLLTAHEVLDCGEPAPVGDELPVVVLGERNSRFGLVVDRFLGERELVVQPLDPRLGKVQDISAAALMEDGTPVLIADVDELARSMGKLVAGGPWLRGGLEPKARAPKRILAVDDSLAVREMERRLLNGRGYVTEVALDGQDAWQAVRSRHFDLVITDVDMPRMDGIELAALIKKDAQLKSIPVMIVSYKDREQDRMRGLEAGADYYLTKSSFEDETLLQAVADLLGEPE